MPEILDDRRLTENEMGSTNGYAIARLRCSRILLLFR